MLSHWVSSYIAKGGWLSAVLVLGWFTVSVSLPSTKSSSSTISKFVPMRYAGGCSSEDWSLIITLVSLAKVGQALASSAEVGWSLLPLLFDRMSLGHGFNLLKCTTCLCLRSSFLCTRYVHSDNFLRTLDGPVQGWNSFLDEFFGTFRFNNHVQNHLVYMDLHESSGHNIIFVIHDLSQQF